MRTIEKVGQLIDEHISPYVDALIVGLLFATLIYSAGVVGALWLLGHGFLPTPTEPAAYLESVSKGLAVAYVFCILIVLGLKAIDRGHTWIKRAAVYLLNVALAVALGVGFLWIMNSTAASAHAAPPFGAMGFLGIILFSAAAGVCRAAYKRSELMPLAVIYVAGVSALWGFFAGATLARGIYLFPLVVQIVIVLSVTIAAIIIGLRLKFTKREKTPFRTRVLGFARFLDRSATVSNLIFGLFFIFLLMGGAAFAFYFLWNWTPPLLPRGRPDNPNLAILTLFWLFWPVRLAVYGVLAAVMWAGVLELWGGLIARLEKKPLEDEKAHGNAGKATEAAAIGAARGGPGKPPWADHPYRD